VSKAPKDAPKAKKFESYSIDTYKTDEQKKEEVGLMTSLSDVEVFAALMKRGLELHVRLNT
jgi:hypothetical protein